MIDSISWRLLRWAYASFYIFFGVVIVLTLLGVMPKPDFDLSPENAAFQDALGKTGFVVPLMGFGFLGAGIAMLFQRTVPLGIVLLAPYMVVMFFTNTMLDSQWIWGSAHAAILIIFAWLYRRAFIPLWNFNSDTDAN